MPYKENVSAEKKLRIVESYLAGEIGFGLACREAGIGQSTFYRWLSRYKTDGVVGFLPKEHYQKYSKETKIAAVLDYLAGQGPMQAICEKYGIRDAKQLRDWLKVYNGHGDFRIRTGGNRMTKGRKTTTEERIRIVKECIANNKDYRGMALKYQVSYQQVYTWTKKYRDMGEPGLEDRRGYRAGTLPSRTPEEELRDRVRQLERENDYLEMENSLLKKVQEIERRRC